MGPFTPADGSSATADDTAGDRPSASSGRLMAWVGLGLLLTVATVGVMAALIGPDRLRTAVSMLEPTWLLVALGIEAVALACLAQVYREVFAVTHGPLSRRAAATIALGSFSLAQVLPGGGAAGAVFAANRFARRSDAVTGTTSVVLFGTTTMATLGVLVSAAATGTAVAAGTHASVAVAAGIITVLVLVALAGFRWVLSRRNTRRRVVAWAARATRRSEDVTMSWQAAVDRQARLLDRPGRLWRIVAWSAVNWTLDIAVLGAIAWAVGVHTPVLAIVVAYGVANLVNSVPLTPGGIGVVEAGIAASLVAMGADPSSASLAAIAYRLVAHWFPIVLALPVVMHGLRQPVESASSACESVPTPGSAPTPGAAPPHRTPLAASDSPAPHDDRPAATPPGRDDRTRDLEAVG